MNNVLQKKKTDAYFTEKRQKKNGDNLPEGRARI